MKYLAHSNVFKLVRGNCGPKLSILGASNIYFGCKQHVWFLVPFTKNACSCDLKSTRD